MICQEKDIWFTYTTWEDFNTAHNITKLIDSENNVYVENTYDDKDRVSSQKYWNWTIYYNYTLINYLASDLDIATFIGIMEPQIKNEDCNDKEVRPLIDAGRKLIFSYVDKTNKEIAQIIIDKSKCLPEASN